MLEFSFHNNVKIIQKKYWLSQTEPKNSDNLQPQSFSSLAVWAVCTVCRNHLIRVKLLLTGLKEKKTWFCFTYCPLFCKVCPSVVHIYKNNPDSGQTSRSITLILIENMPLFSIFKKGASHYDTNKYIMHGCPYPLRSGIMFTYGSPHKQVWQL